MPTCIYCRKSKEENGFRKGARVQRFVLVQPPAPVSAIGEPTAALCALPPLSRATSRIFPERARDSDPARQRGSNPGRVARARRCAGPEPGGGGHERVVGA